MLHTIFETLIGQSLGVTLTDTLLLVIIIILIKKRRKE